MDIGASHVNMSQKSCGSLWDIFGECLAEVITKQDCIRPKRECAKAWISLISFLVGCPFAPRNIFYTGGRHEMWIHGWVETEAVRKVEPGSSTTGERYGRPFFSWIHPKWWILRLRKLWRTQRPQHQRRLQLPPSILNSLFHTMSSIIAFLGFTGLGWWCLRRSSLTDKFLRVGATVSECVRRWIP